MSRPASPLLPLALLAVTACGGGGSSPAPDPTAPAAGTKTLTARHDGTPWTATVRLGAYNQGTLTIAGHDGAGRSLNISALRIAGPGTYAIGAGNPNVAVATWVDGTGQYSSAAASGTGTLTLTAASLARVAGTFSFVAASASGGQARTVTVTNGTFDLSNP